MVNLSSILNIQRHFWVVWPSWLELEVPSKDLAAIFGRYRIEAVLEQNFPNAVRIMLITPLYD